MRPFRSYKQKPFLRCRLCFGVLLAGIALLWVADCRKSVRTDDPQLRPVQELLDAQLPPGTSEDKVKTFLEQQDYTVLPSQGPGTVVALLPATGNRENSPVAVHVIFYFDANGKLNTFALTRASGEDRKQ